MKTELTLNVLQTMIAQEYEDIRAAGSDERRELTHAVMRDAKSPDSASQKTNISIPRENKCVSGDPTIVRSFKILSFSTATTLLFTANLFQAIQIPLPRLCETGRQSLYTILHR